jgi:hypothetical protein
LPLKTSVQRTHPRSDAFKFGTCTTGCEVRGVCGCVREGTLPGNLRLTAVTVRMFNEYFAGWKTDRDAHGASLASLFEDLGGQTRLGVVLGAFDNPDGGNRGGGALSACGNGRYGWQRRSARGQMQKLSAGKFHGVPSQETKRPRAVGFAAKADVSRYLRCSPADGTHAAAEIGWARHVLWQSIGKLPQLRVDTEGGNRRYWPFCDMAQRSDEVWSQP